MESAKYTVSQFPISSILGFIQANAIAVPEIQRPFVWKRSQVRDLVDSLFNGFPTGYLIIWQSPNVRVKGQGTSIGKKLLIDGQQRVTAMMASLLGYKVVGEDYKETNIRIAFNPFPVNGEERFAVQDQSHLRSKKWISDIATLFRPDFSVYGFIQNYLKDNPDVDPNILSNALTEVRAIANRQIGVIDLSHELSIDEVTEIFIRINSQGKTLSQSDFAMSKIAADETHGGHTLRKAIDYFCHLAVDPNFYTYIENNDKEFMESEYSHLVRWLKDDKESIYDPDYNDMLRVSFMHRFGRGKLGDLVSLLSGRNFVTQVYEEEIAEKSFEELKIGVKNFMNQYHFSQFLLAIKSAGFITSRLINSQLTLDFAYTLYLLLSCSPDIPKHAIMRYVQKWYVLSVLTGRYVNSPESAMDRDMRSIAQKGFEHFFQETESAELSDAFWDIGLVQSLETTSTISPYFNVFLAAQILSHDRSLFSSTITVENLLSLGGDVHHIFPREFLKRQGVTDRYRYNQVANFIYLDTQINISIADRAPSEYFTIVSSQCETGECRIGTIAHTEGYIRALSDNCIPDGIASMTVDDFGTFLEMRRKLMAMKIKEYYQSL
jgi:hypothetical protein